MQNPSIKKFVWRIALYALPYIVSGCSDTYLAVKPDQALVVPQSLADFQALLDNARVVNGDLSRGSLCFFGQVGCDDYAVMPAAVATLDHNMRLSYLWSDELSLNTSSDWTFSYEQAFYANVVLSGLKSKSLTGLDADRLRGQALFVRAFAFYQLLQVFAPPYHPETAESDLGIPLRLDPDVLAKTPRATVAACYRQVLEDLEEAASLLPDTQPFPTRPTQQAAHGLLARVNLLMSDYDTALVNAGKALTDPSLLDYNDFSDWAVSGLIPRFNTEVLYHGGMNTATLFIYPTTIVHPELMALYGGHDLRRQRWYMPNVAGDYTYRFGHYTSTLAYFAGILKSEIMLIKAESLARLGQPGEAMEALNTLRRHRMDEAHYTPLSATEGTDALVKVLEERRRELAFKGLRWSDLRRLNQDPRFAKTLTRDVNGTVYTLPPNDPRYTYPIPLDELALNPMPQNAR